MSITGVEGGGTDAGYSSRHVAELEVFPDCSLLFLKKFRVMRRMWLRKEDAWFWF